MFNYFRLLWNNKLYNVYFLSKLFLSKTKPHNLVKNLPIYKPCIFLCSGKGREMPTWVPKCCCISPDNCKKIYQIVHLRK